MKVKDQTMLKLYKEYSIFFPIEVTKKLTKQYIGPFQIEERISHLAYKLKVPNNWKIHLVFSVALLQPAPNPAKDPFQYPRLQQLFLIFVESDINKHKFFKIERFLNKHMIIIDISLAVEYLVYWTEYGPKWERQYNVKDLNNATKLIQVYKKGLARQKH